MRSGNARALHLHHHLHVAMNEEKEYRVMEMHSLLFSRRRLSRTTIILLRRFYYLSLTVLSLTRRGNKSYSQTDLAQWQFDWRRLLVPPPTTSFYKRGAQYRTNMPKPSRLCRDI
jgi:fatty acid desaturase